MNPYEQQPVTAFWRSAVAGRDPMQISGLWTPKFTITPSDRISTYGSCFAQHFSAALVARSHQWMCHESGPSGLSPAHAKAFNFNVYSSRTGNIYTTSMLAQWCRWALADCAFPDEIWREDDRYFDPIRPAIEPDGFASEAEVKTTRATTRDAFRKSVIDADIFVFTLGLTECWRNTKTGLEYPLCPGTAAGVFDQQIHMFHNTRFGEALENLTAAIDLMKTVNPALKFLLTVSPVPLVATASRDHVLSATTFSKSILRAVAGDLALTRAYIDYFPSYEMIASAPFKAQFYQDNLRSVTKAGVDFVMNLFFAAQNSPPAVNSVSGAAQEPGNAEKLVCEEEILSAFGPDP